MAYSERKSKLDATAEWRTQYAFHFCLEGILYRLPSSLVIEPLSSITYLVA